MLAHDASCAQMKVAHTLKPAPQSAIGNWQSTIQSPIPPITKSPNSLLPNFLLIGAAKSGTTSLYHQLRQHPDVFMPAVKEPRFFAYVDDPPAMVGPGDRASNEAAGAVYAMEDYAALFAGTEDAAAVGEASVNYLYSETAPRRIRETIPDVQLIAVLRNPVERAYSHYLHLVRSGRETIRDVRQALAAEPERIRQGWEWSWHYTRMGLYHEQLSRYLQYFDRDQLSVYLFDDFRADNVAVAQDVYRTLGVDDAFVPATSAQHEKTGVPKLEWFQQFLLNPDNPLRRASRYLLPEEVREYGLRLLKNLNLTKPEMPPDVRAELATFFADDVHRLESLIDRDLSHWLRHVQSN
jgi:hypothetical protein